MLNNIPPLLTLENEISRLPILAGAEEAVLRDIIAAATVSYHEKGETFLCHNDPTSRTFIVLEGWCGASKGNHEGQEAIIELFRCGDFLQEPTPATEKAPPPLTIQVLTPSRLLSLAPNAILQACEKSKIISDNLLNAYARRCRELREHVEQLALLNAEQRVGRFLLQMRFSKDPEGNDIVLPIDKLLIASYLGIKPETFSRTLSLFKSKGFIVERNHLITPHLQALCEYCDLINMQSCRFVHSPECAHSSNNDAVVI